MHALFAAFGLAAPPREALGDTPYCTDSMGTMESERLVALQRRSFDDFRAAMAALRAPSV